MVAAKYAQPTLDEELDYILTYVFDPVRVRLRLLKSLDKLHPARPPRSRRLGDVSYIGYDRRGPPHAAPAVVAAG